MITIYIVDANGFFLEELTQTKYEPLPRNSVLSAPPQGDIVQWDGKKWNVRDAYPQVDIGVLRKREISSATSKRWAVMTGGLTLPNGIEIGTTIDDQNRITSVVANAALAGLADADEVDFKAASGWVRVTIAEIKQIAGAIGQFVQACYTAERAHHDAIEALQTREEIVAYDVSAGWPE